MRGAASNPSTRSQLVCSGVVSSANLNVRPSETVACTLQILDADGQPTFGLAGDFRAPAVVGGSGLSGFSQASASSLSFTVVAPASYYANFSLLGLMQNGSAFTQGPVVFAVGEWEGRWEGMHG